MNKISLIISREYTTRVRKKTFIIMTIIGPVLFAALMILPAYLAQMEDTDEKLIAVVDETHLFAQVIPETKYIKFDYIDQPLSQAKKMYKGSKYFGILYIPSNILYNAGRIQLFSEKQPSLGVQSHIENALEKDIERMKLHKFNIDNIDNILKAVKTDINLETIKVTESGEEKSSPTEIKMIVGYVSGFMIYIFIFMFGAQVMRGVIEEKSNRIIEVIISSVKPFELMMGKIVGVALVGLTQFLLWMVLTFGLVTVFKSTLMPEPDLNAMKVQTEMLQGSGMQQAAPVNTEDFAKVKDIFSEVEDINFPLIIGCFIFFFLGGYLLYSSMFAAIGAAVDNEADTQQFMFPVTIPLILAIVVMMNAITNPEGPIAFWFSMIPFTSPVVMMVRIPTHVPYWQLALSATILIATFIGTTWMAGKIYRVGILMYGKKVNYLELWKWIRYKS